MHSQCFWKVVKSSWVESAAYGKRAEGSCWHALGYNEPRAATSGRSWWLTEHTPSLVTSATSRWYSQPGSFATTDTQWDLLHWDEARSICMTYYGLGRACEWSRLMPWMTLRSPSTHVASWQSLTSDIWPQIDLQLCKLPIRSYLRFLRNFS